MWCAEANEGYKPKLISLKVNVSFKLQVLWEFWVWLWNKVVSSEWCLCVPRLFFNLFDTIVWVIYGEPEISTHCNLRKHVNRQNNKLRKQLHQSDNTCKVFRKHTTNPENHCKSRKLAAISQATRSCFQRTVKGDEHGSDTLVVAMVCGTSSPVRVSSIYSIIATKIQI